MTIFLSIHAFGCHTVLVFLLIKYRYIKIEIEIEILLIGTQRVQKQFDNSNLLISRATRKQ